MNQQFRNFDEHPVCTMAVRIVVSNGSDQSAKERIVPLSEFLKPLDGIEEPSVLEGAA